MATPIKHAPRLTLTQIGTAILATGPKRPFEVSQFITEVYRLGAKIGYDPVALIAQCCFETAIDGKPFRSALWEKYLNPAGIGQTDSAAIDRLETDDPIFAARVFVVHVGGYVDGPDGGWLKDTAYKAHDPRWKYLTDKEFGKVKNVEDWGGGLWASEATPKKQYTDGTIKYMKLMGWTSDKATPAPPVVEAPSNVTLPYILLTSGHRSDGDPGNPTEKYLTQFLAVDNETAFRAAGYTCDWWQKSLDGDSDPTMTTGGGLDKVALGCGRILRARPEPLSIMLDLHYNGPHSPVHAIVPDTVGLGTAYQGGAPVNDTAAVNVWDVQLGSAIAQSIVKATGLGLYNGRLGVPGVMSERDTGVAIQYSARLAMFAATADSRNKAIRLVIEHGGFEDEPATKDDFSAKCAAATVDAVNAFVKTTLK